jgi:hypothetical protein
MKREVPAAATVIAALVVAASAGCRDQSEQASMKNASSAGDVSIPVTSDTNPISALKTMGAYLQTLKTFAVDVNGTKEMAIDDEQNLQFTGTVHYLVQAPNSLRAELRTDRKQRDYVYDGKTLTVYAPRMNYYATVAAPPTIRALLDTAVQRFDLEFPVADLFLWGTDRADFDDIKSSAYVGPAKIDGRDCDHFAYRQDDMDWQLWIERGSKPLPCKLVITSLDLPSRPEYSAVIKFDLSPKVDAKSFAFAPPKGANPIKLHDFVTDATKSVAQK